MDDALAEWLNAIDAEFTNGHIPLPNRPFEACRILIDRAVLSVDRTEIVGERFEEYLTSPWFKKLYRAVHDWYEDRYGRALRTPHSYLTGAVLISGVPFEVRVPVTISKVEEPGKTAWVTFPSRVHDGETPRNWIQEPPHLDRLGGTLGRTLDGDLNELATQLRNIRLNLSCAEQADPGSQALVDKVIPHLEAAAHQFLRGDKGTLGLAAWDSHQAAESVLKLLRRQVEGEHRTSHDLPELLSDLSSDVATGIDSSLVSSLPSGRRIVQIRAGEGARLSLAEAYDIYRGSIQVANQAAQRLRRGLRTHDAEFLIQKLPWID